MVTEGQRQRRLKLTDQDVRSAASLILEELLEDRIDKDLRGHRKIRRIRTGPESTNLGIHISEFENAVARSKTLPANYRELTNGELKQKNVEESSDKIHHELKQKNIEESSDKIHREDNPHIVDSSGSSADTEDNSSNIYEKRKKKSFLKRARERLHLAFHRNRNVENATAKEANDKSRTEKQKTRKNARKSKNESQHYVQAHTRGGLVDDTTGQVDYVDKDGSAPAESRSTKKWNSKILTSFRRSKKSHEGSGDARHQKKTDSKDHVRENGHNGIEQSVPGKVLPLPLLQIQSRNRGVLSSPQHPLTPQQDRDSPKQSQSPGQQDRPVSPKQRQSPGQQDRPVSPKQPQSPGHFQSQDGSVASSHEATSSSPEASNILIGTSIFSQTNAISASPDNSQRPYIGYRSLVFNTSNGSNVLDSPGDDIEFIDALDTENVNECSKGSYSKQVQNSKSVYQFHAGYPKDSRSTNQFADDSHVTDVEVDPQDHRPDGGSEAAALITSRLVVVPGEPEEEVYDELDGEMDDECDGSPDSDPDKEALYSAIAQRLIEMGDSYSASVSDLKSKSEDPASMKHLSPLETDIVNCLRSVGDKMTSQSKQDKYHRFQSTVQNTFHGDISWNHLVLLFYATKNVVSFVGKGSQAAVLAKDFTVQYVSDSCASWIIDQVGSDILQSSEESDFGVD